MQVEAGQIAGIGVVLVHRGGRLGITAPQNRGLIVGGQMGNRGAPRPSPDHRNPIRHRQ